jgi:hypothetical protein
VSSQGFLIVSFGIFSFHNFKKPFHEQTDKGSEPSGHSRSSNGLSYRARNIGVSGAFFFKVFPLLPKIPNKFLKLFIQTETIL